VFIHERHLWIEKWTITQSFASVSFESNQIKFIVNLIKTYYIGLENTINKNDVSANMIDKDMMGKGCDADAESEWDHSTARYRNNNQHEKGVECIRVTTAMN
jgi:hypothetical protein